MEQNRYIRADNGVTVRTVYNTADNFGDRSSIPAALAFSSQPISTRDTESKPEKHKHKYFYIPVKTIQRKNKKTINKELNTIKFQFPEMKQDIKQYNNHLDTWDKHRDSSWKQQLAVL